jgi:hypothetical protein
MHKYSQKATSFVVMAHYAGENREVRSFVVDEKTPIGEVFRTLWPVGDHEVLAGSRFAPTPFRIEIAPDEKSITAVDEPSPFERGSLSA